ncbi:MAG: ABC transporter permease [Clostridiales bacterium]
MSFIESMKQAFDSLKSNKLRTILTMLGIIMGIFSLITIVSIGNSTRLYLNAEVEKLGANTITINGLNTKSSLNMEDIELIKKAVPEIKSIKPQSSGVGYIEKDNIDDEESTILYTATTSQQRNFSSIEMLHGRFLSESDVKFKSKVIVLDETGAKKLFKRTNVIGETIDVKDSILNEIVKFKIIGISKSDNGLFGEMMSSFIPFSGYIPITTLLNINSKDSVDSIVVMVDNKEDLATVGNKISRALKFKHGNDKKYISQSSADTQKSMDRITNIISIILSIIALITLLVGGIGVMNILLVSVTERIREIGIRKALGAQNKDIVFQFLSESIIITLLSGIIGIALGLGIGAIISSYLKIPPVIDILTISLTIIGSIIFGLIFGVYPALKAAKLDPIESLRYE